MIFEPFHDNQYCHSQQLSIGLVIVLNVKVCFRSFFSILLKTHFLKMKLSVSIEFPTFLFSLFFFKFWCNTTKKKLSVYFPAETYLPNFDHG